MLLIFIFYVQRLSRQQQMAKEIDEIFSFSFYSLPLEFIFAPLSNSLFSSPSPSPSSVAAASSSSSLSSSTRAHIISPMNEQGKIYFMLN